MRNLRRVVLLVLLLALVGCSSLKLGYRFGDWVVLYRIDSYFDLTSQQKILVEKTIDDFFLWHPREEIPQYITLLHQMRQDAETQVSSERWNYYFQQYHLVKERTLRYGIPKISYILTQLQPKQIKNLKLELAEENQDLAEKNNLSLKERKKIRTDNHLERFEEWIGSLTDQQKEQIIEFSQALPVTGDLRLEYRLQSQAAFYRLMEKYPQDQQQIESFLIKNWLIREESWALGYREAWKEVGTRFKLFLIDFSQGLTEKQKQTLLAKLDSIIKDLQDLQKSA